MTGCADGSWEPPQLSVYLMQKILARIQKVEAMRAAMEIQKIKKVEAMRAAMEAPKFSAYVMQKIKKVEKKLQQSKALKKKGKKRVRSAENLADAFRKQKNELDEQNGFLMMRIRALVEQTKKFDEETKKFDEETENLNSRMRAL